MKRDLYLGVALVLIVLMAYCATTRSWRGDFWAHAAAVRELSLRPFHPRHPEVAAPLPGLFFTPYAVAVGWLARLAGVSAITGLAMAGICNLVLILVALRLYLCALFNSVPQPHSSSTSTPGAVDDDGEACAGHANRQAGLVAFYTVMCVLFLWGPSPWMWSGFFHLQVLPAVLPYPSTFATGLSLCALAMHLGWLRDRRRRFWPVCLSAAVILLTHPVTAVACGVGVVVQAVTIRGDRSVTEHLAAFSAIAVFASGAAWAWPYYPFFAAVAGSADYHEANADMYVDVWRPVWPAIAAVPCLAWRLWNNRRDPVALGFVGVACLYTYGGVTGAFAYGRVLSHAVMTAHLGLGAWIAESEMRYEAGRRISPMRGAGLVVVAAVFAIAVSSNAAEICSALFDRPDTVRPYQFLSRYVGHDEVVLSDLESSYAVPAFGGKVVSHVGNLTFVSDAAERHRAVERFFDDSATTRERMEIIQRYDVRWLLLDRRHANASRLAQSYALRTSPAFVDEHWVLIELSPSDAAARFQPGGRRAAPASAETVDTTDF
jgi:alpha-1,6-mannosyltransferase